VNELVVEAILFDSDGVLVDSHAQVDTAWSILAAAVGLDMGELRASLAGVPARDTLARHLSGTDLDDAVRHLEELEIAGAADTAAVPGAVALTTALGDHAFAIATSATRRLAAARWSAAGIAVPKVVVTADDVGRGKPDPEPFLTAAARLGVDPRRCVVFEDSNAGAIAARSAGAAVIAVGPTPWTVPCLARVPDLRGVTATPAPDGIRLHLPS
jgi:sugar-phosphatase